MAHTSASASTSTSASASASASTSISASASASASGHMYDVFLNHKGIDVKKTLASHMYRRLLSHGLKVFLDQPELQRGECLTHQIKEAIASASVHVAIFSPRYAESSWCLDELVLMLESRKKSGATIIPVFYKVQPSDLRWTDKAKNNDRVSAQALTILQETGRYGVFLHALRILRWTGKDTVYVQALKNIRWTGSDRVYAQALLTHEKKARYDDEKIAAWRRALAEVSYISGFELDRYDGDEGALVDKVVQQVMKKVKKPPLHVAVHPTGLDNKLNDFERMVLLQQQHSGQAKVVGIRGLGGVGKTTMAKEFFNRKSSSYGRSSFLAEVREAAAARSSLTSLQSQLYRDLTGSAEVMNSVDEGTGMLRRAFSGSPRSPVLIILDDVDHVEQLLAFYSPRDDVLHPGSLIIVTSRNKEVFENLDIEASCIYNMEGLDKKHSKLLFCKHAFNEDLPVVEFEKVVGKFLKLCAGLPLSLKVLGRLLHGKKDLGYWEGQLQKIFKSGLHKDIQSVLRISYDSLEEEEKNIFLDIACFFIGTKKDKAIRIWEGSGWAGSVGFLNLVSKCLVEIDSENCIRMHDQLRDLGRYLAEKEPLGSGLRLWRPTDSPFLNVPPQSTVRGINIDLESIIGEECSNHLVDMRGLQLLSAPLDFLESISEVLRKADLVWLSLRIHSFSTIPCLPSWIPIRNLRVLELEGLYREEFVRDEPEARLETLWETENEVPLELKELRVPSKLLRLPRSIGQLKHLEMIELDAFLGSSLPEEFFDLHSLKHLKLSAFRMKSLPDSLGKLTNLQHVNLYFSMLKALPSAIGDLCNLKILELECPLLEILPSAIGDLCNLKILKLQCPSLEILPPSLCNLTNLERFSIHYCLILKCLPDSIGELKQLISLSIHNTGIEYLPACLRELNNLEVLEVWKCPIREVPFASVEKAHKCMVRLKRLELMMTRITEISFGEGVCPNLQELILLYCHELVEIGALPTTLTSLEMDMSYRNALNRIRGISGLRKLQELGLPLKMLIKLQWVGISKCDKMTMIESLKAAVTPESDIFKKLNLKLIKVVEENDVSEAEDFQESGAEEN